VDKDLRKNVRKNWLTSIFEFAHLDFQKKVWLEATFKNYVSDYTEAICQYFDDLDLKSGFEKFVIDGFATQSEYEILKSFDTELRKYTERPEKRNLSDRKILLDPEWIEITNGAKIAWQNLKTLIKDQTEIDYISGLEKQFLNENGT
jgi:hypothetical protein